MLFGNLTSTKTAHSSESSSGGELQSVKIDTHNADSEKPVQEIYELLLCLLELAGLTSLKPFPGLGPLQHLETHDPRMYGRNMEYLRGQKAFE